MTKIKLHFYELISAALKNFCRMKIINKVINLSNKFPSIASIEKFKRDISKIQLKIQMNIEYEIEIIYKS